MQLHELQKAISGKKLSEHLYIFTGEEVAVMDIYISKMIDIVVGEVIRPDTLQEVYHQVGKKRLGSGAKLYIVREDKEFLKQEKVWEQVFINIRNSQDYVIFIYSALDKRGKFYKQHQSLFTDFAKLSADTLVKYIQKDYALATPRAQYLVDICENDYNRILMECHKIKSYSVQFAKYPDAMDRAFDDLIDKGCIYKPIGDITFKLTDAIAMRKITPAFDYLKQARDKGESDVMILSILYNSFRQILLVQGLGPDKTDASNRTGLTSWQVKMATDKLGYYSIPELIDNLKRVREVEVGIKSGTIDSDCSLEYLLAHIL